MKSTLLATSSVLIIVASAFGAAVAPTAGIQSISTFNPFVGHEFFISPVYRPKALKAAANLTARGEFALAKKAVKVATSISSFLWVSDFATVPNIANWLREAELTQKITGKKQVVQIEIYNLPDRDCSAKVQLEQTFIQQVKKELQRFSNVRVVLQLETDAIGNLVTNLAVPKCGNAAPAYKRSLSYAIANLQLPNVALYLDGAHAAWLGWDSNVGPTATVIGDLLTAATALNPKATIRGIATDVSNYNGLGNQPQEGYDELKYIRKLAPLLAAQGIDVHFIVDQGRSGNQASVRSGGDWCNNKFAGFGPRPTVETPDPLIDAIVWVKPGGEADGTSDATAERYDVACGSETSLIPAPEAGTWFQEYFEQLLKQADPPL
ncbi:putative cellulose 1,4-beta-cellobiosidase II precursor [Lyophyllum atratum]|nr:putative cellulose 1,4-beta-cellobiosidase II precursor [Lyophyllum atratum]